MSVLMTLLSAAAYADAWEEPQASQVEAAAQTTAAAKDLDEPEEWPIYVSTRGSVAVPAGGLGQVPTGGIGLGVELDNGHTFGMRAIYINNPPPNPISNNRDITQAWGPVLDYQFHIDNTRNMNFYPTLSLGFVYSAEEGKENVILPIFEAGFGARITRETASGDRLFISPELGVVPGALAPYTSLTVGMIFGPDKGA